MKILSVGPIVSKQTPDNSPDVQSRIIVSVEDALGKTLHLRFFSDWFHKQDDEAIKKAVKAVLSFRHSPDSRFRSLKGVEI